MDLAAEAWAREFDAMSAETMTLFSPRLAARFDALVEKYPVRRSALIPMLLYAQDELAISPML